MKKLWTERILQYINFADEVIKPKPQDRIKLKFVNIERNCDTYEMLHRI